MKKFCLLFLACSIFAACNSVSEIKQSQATLVITNAHIWTGNSIQPYADAIAVNKDTIIFVGDSVGIKKFISNSTQIIDAQGATVTPGFIDAHVHFIDGGLNLASVQLRDANTKILFLQRIKDFANTIPAGDWILGGDWDQTLWGGEMPDRSWLDSITPNNPVFINRLDGHMIVANSLALKAANINAATKDITGGEIARDNKGNPTGILKDNAQDLVYKVIPTSPDAVLDKALDAAMNYVASKGVTSVHSMGTWSDVATYKRAQKSNRLKTRIYANVPLRTWQQLRDEVAKNGHGDAWLHIGGLKGFVDGALGSHTAMMMQPLLDKPNLKGLYITPLDSLYYFTSQADKAGLQVMVHAIGDEAIHQQLNIYERVEKENGTRDRRFRIEHAQHIAPSDISRFASLNVIASMQPYQIIDDGRWAEKLLGHKRSETTYAIRSLVDTKAIIAGGSDWPVSPPTPLEGIYGAVTRRTLDEKQPNGWIPEQKISVEEALRCYTYNAAFAEFEETHKGTLQVGKLADIVILDADIFKIAPEKIRDMHVVKTIVGGKIIYSK